MKFFITGLFAAFIFPSAAQPYDRHVYFDKEKKKLKSAYQVQDTISNIYDGACLSFFENGKAEAKGQFKKNMAVGDWEFYYESGGLKMKGPYHNNVNQGVWEFYFEGGGKSMEGELHNNSKEGAWKLFYEGGGLKETGAYKNNVRIGEWQAFYPQGELKSKTIYQDKKGLVMEFYPSGKKKGEGMQENLLKTGEWRYFSEEGKLFSKGNYEEGKKSGLWNEFFDNGKPASQGTYANDEPTGNWTYFYKDGNVSENGVFEYGKKAGIWQSFTSAGALKSEVQYKSATGEYIGYYPSHKIKMKGQFENDKRTGLWTFYSENGTKEGECQYAEGKGTFSGFYPNGVLKNKGQIEDDRRVGQWELYDAQGKLTGYYIPIYREPEVKIPLPKTVVKAPPKKAKRHSFFTPRYPEYKSVILSVNPFFSLLGYMPFNLEFYAQERIGYEFALETIRTPFFVSDKNALPFKIYSRGVSLQFRQKFYVPAKHGMFYAAHSLGSVSLHHWLNSAPPVGTIVSAQEQIYEYSVMIGDRWMQGNNRDGVTIDAYVGYSFGIRQFTDGANAGASFHSLERGKFVSAFRFGLTFGYSISFSER